VGLSISASACGQCHACACVFVCICKRIHMYVGIYTCAFFCSECYMHFTGVLGTSAWAGLYVTQVCFYTNVHICEHTLTYTSGKKTAKMAEKGPRFGGPWPSWELAWTMNWVDQLRTSADKQMWSGRRAVVMRTGRRAELLGVKLGCPRSRCGAVVSDVLCVRSYVHFVCVCVYMCMCVCVRT